MTEKTIEDIVAASTAGAFVKIPVGMKKEVIPVFNLRMTQRRIASGLPLSFSDHQLLDACVAFVCNNARYKPTESECRSASEALAVEQASANPVTVSAPPPQTGEKT